jgi:two-component system cell cycle sensor histidine kinase/response regulator CckA
MPGNRVSRVAPPGSDELLTAQSLVIEMIASGERLDGVLRTLAAFIDKQAPAGRCCIFLLNSDRRTLRVGATSKLPRSFTRAIEKLPIGLKCAACGTAAYRRERVIIPNVATDPLCEDFVDLFLRHGLHACWSTPIRASDGEVLGTVAVYYTRKRTPQEREIAAVESAIQLAGIAIERQRIEARLQADREQSRSLIEYTSDLVSIVSESGIIRYMSPSVERLLGFKPSELVGTSGSDSLAFQEALRQPGLCQPIEQRFRHKDGSWRVFETTANNQLSNPSIAGVIVTGRDITNRKGAEEEVIATEERYRELFENANDVIFTSDLAGNLMSLNKAGELLLGYGREELMGMSFARFVAPESKALAREMLDRKLGGEPKTVYELDFIRKQGDRVPMEMSTRLIFKMGKPVAVQGIVRDITERRRLESHLAQSHKMEALGRLAGGVAHDFNNLLTVITGYSHWMLDDLPADSPLTESASEILLAANRAAVLTNQLLAFTRSQVVQPIVVDLNHLVTQLDQMLRRIIGEDIELVAAMSPNLGLIKADPGQIEQVILNLVINARDAMPAGGKVLLETANVEIDQEQALSRLDCSPGSYVMLAVSDSGCGFGEYVKSRIFEPFFTTKETGKGTGLGLSTVYGIVKQGCGCIAVESAPGAGAVFRIYLPKVADGAAPRAASPPISRTGGAETILLVEDESALRRIAREMLLRLGYTVLDAPNGLEAQKVLLDYGKPIQLLLTDVVMPEQGGRDLAGQLKALHGDLKILFMSGYAGDAIVHQGLLEPGTAYLQKPFSLYALASKIRELLDN